ncbi:HemX domain-containing protein [Methyloglobulus morosus KoM1]|uniref:HemX domain-containing protein n=1 Tax=Methyloglobulus morosus KoM1 TaxID=1116472 RepID=V5C7B0_9GAMM|nr:uroporphyrinogen-III C-methyltransferase [Methyloglobulus morosus]ESS72623.1 HemX domain-containing protein [Methyloglobulus morosus KoM1]
MAELSEQPEQVAVIKPNDDKPQSSPKSNGGLWFGITMLLIFSIAGAGFYFFTQLRDKQEGLGGEVKGELTRQVNDYQAQLTAIQSQVAALQSEIAGKEDHFNKTLADFSGLHTQKMEATRKELSDKVLQVQRQLGKTRGDWLVADAEYLLSVANERLHLVGDINTTRVALEAADQRLRESGDTGTIKIREQIAKELSQIQDINVPDLVGLYTSIQTLESEVAKLALVLPYSGKPLTPPGEASNSSAVSEDSNDLLNAAIQELEGIVTIKHSDKPVKEILTKEQAEFIREQLKVKLEMVKMALVQQNDALYQAALADLKIDVGQHFTVNDAAKKFADEISRLQTIKLRSQLPDISLSLKMLRDVTKLRIETDKALATDEEPVTQEKPAEPLDSKEPTTKPSEPIKPVDSRPSETAPPKQK